MRSFFTQLGGVFAALFSTLDLESKVGLGHLLVYFISDLKETIKGTLCVKKSEPQTALKMRYRADLFRWFCGCAGGRGLAEEAAACVLQSRPGYGKA